jgi:glutamyl-tRNA synthetase
VQATAGALTPPLTRAHALHTHTHTQKVEEEDDFQQLVNPNTKQEALALADVNVASLKKGDLLQFERKGYYIVDRPYGGPQQPAVVFNIPDGRTKNLELGFEAAAAAAPSGGAAPAAQR